MRVIPVVLFCSYICFPALAAAQCQSDNDCKGDRICEEGACIAPSAAPAPVYAPQYAQPMQLAEPQFGRNQRPPTPGWSTAGGVIGIIMGTVALSFTIASEAVAHKGDATLPLAIGGSAFIPGIVGAILPSVSLLSVRGASGTIGLKIAGWIGAGGATVSGLALMGIGLADKDTPAGVIVLTGGLFFVGVTCLSIDAFIAGSRARKARAEYVQVSEARPRPIVLPTVFRGSRGDTVPGAVLAMQF